MVFNEQHMVQWDPNGEYNILSDKIEQTSNFKDGITKYLSAFTGFFGGGVE